MGIIQKQGIQNAFITYLGLIVGFVSLLIIQPAYLTPEEVGLTRVLISFSLLVAVFLPLGVTNITIRYFPHFRDESTRHRGYFGFMLLFPLVGFLFTALILYLLRGFFVKQYSEQSALFAEYFVYVIPFSLILGMVNVLNSYSFSIFKTSFPTLLNDVIVKVLFMGVILIYSFGLITLPLFLSLFIGIYLVQAIILLLYIYVTDRPSLRINVPFLRKQGVGEIFQYGFLLSLGALASLGLKSLDAIMLAKFEPLAIVGVYIICAFIPTVIEAPFNALEKITTTKLASATAHKREEEIKTIYYKSARYMLLVGGLLFICININIRNVLEFLRPEYMDGINVVMIISIGSLAIMAGGSNAQIIFSSEKYKIGVFLLIVLLLTAFVSNLIFIPRFGMEGAAMSTALASIIYSGLRVAYLRYRFKYQPFDKNTLYIIVLILACFGINFLLPGFKNNFVDIIFRSSIITIIYLAGTYVFNIIPEFHHLLQLKKKK
ncbi:MAG: lipopolysaccharide biosynthesis protein [Bacteroidia bacterium]